MSFFWIKISIEGLGAVGFRLGNQELFYIKKSHLNGIHYIIKQSHVIQFRGSVVFTVGRRWSVQSIGLNKNLVKRLVRKWLGGWDAFCQAQGPASHPWGTRLIGGGDRPPLVVLVSACMSFLSNTNLKKSLASYARDGHYRYIFFHNLMLVCAVLKPRC